MQNNINDQQGRPLWIPALIVGCVVAFAAGGAVAFWGRSDDQAIDTRVEAESETTTLSSSPDDADDPGDDEPTSPTSSSDNTAVPTSSPDEDSQTTTPPAGSTLEDGRPATFWAITEEAYELVEVDTLTGEIVGAYGGWGMTLASCDGDEACLIQVIDDVQLASDGTLYLSDCCEPAVGNIYHIEAGDQFDPLVPGAVQYGTNPLPSPDATLVASDELGSIAVRFADGENALSRYPSDGGDGTSASWYRPLAWLDGATLVFTATQGETAQLGFLDVSDPTNPVVVGETIEGPAFLAAGIRSDGKVLALVSVPVQDEDGLWLDWDIVGRAFDPETGAVVAEIDLPNSVFDMDYDASHTYLITSASDGVVRWYGAGKSGEIGRGFIAATW